MKNKQVLYLKKMMKCFVYCHITNVPVLKCNVKKNKILKRKTLGTGLNLENSYRHNRCKFIKTICTHFLWNITHFYLCDMHVIFLYFVICFNINSFHTKENQNLFSSDIFNPDYICFLLVGSSSALFKI